MRACLRKGSSRWGWLGLLASVLVAMGTFAMASGQSVGPLLGGDVTGSTGLTVSQAVTLDTDLSLGRNPAATGDDTATTRNDEGTHFTVAIELHAGQQASVTLYLQNHSGADASAILELFAPSGIDAALVEVSNGFTWNTSVISEARLGREAWLLVVHRDAGEGENDGVRLTIEPKDDLRPGFYTITGRIVQTAG